MSGNDWNRLGRDVKDIVQNAIDTGDFGALNRDLGVTLENALGNMARSLKNPGSNGFAGTYSSSSERMQRAREKFALFVNTRKMKAGSIAALVVGLALAISCGFALGIVGVTALFLDSIVKPFAITASVLLPIGLMGVAAAIWGNQTRKKVARFRSYVKTLNGKPYGSIKDLAKGVRKSEKFVIKDIEKMIEKRMFLEGHLDSSRTCLIASDEAYEQYVETERNVQRMKEQEAKNPKSSFLRKQERLSRRETSTLRISEEAMMPFPA